LLVNGWILWDWQNPKQVLDALKLGEIERIEFAVEQITDEFMIYGIRGGLIDELSNSFPDPRKECEITITDLKRERKVDATIPLRSDMLAYEDSLVTAYHLDSMINYFFFEFSMDVFPILNPAVKLRQIH
jgi:hypothetical protein